MNHLRKRFFVWQQVITVLLLVSLFLLIKGGFQIRTFIVFVAVFLVVEMVLNLLGKASAIYHIFPRYKGLWQEEQEKLGHQVQKVNRRNVYGIMMACIFLLLLLFLPKPPEDVGWSFFVPMVTTWIGSGVGQYRRYVRIEGESDEEFQQAEVRRVNVALVISICFVLIISVFLLLHAL
ncbi:hypothetical protein LC040_02495 [Bacillus tianshenii]|nr:hypothetical protein LC040_02495 [Bacillus tianshenii]